MPDAAEWIIVAGKLVVDEVLRLSDPLVRGGQQRASDAVVVGGGQVWHTSLAAASAGARVRATGWCGGDAVSTDLRRALREAGVDDHLVVAGAAVRAIVLVEPDGERTIVSTGGSGHLDTGRLDIPSILAGACWLHVDGFALDAVGAEALLQLADEAHARGIPVSAEPPSVASMATRRAGLAGLPPLACLLGRPDEVAACADVLRAVPACIITHDQGRPVRLRGPNGEASIPVPPEVPASLGAGDRFAGGVLAARTAGAPWEAAVAAGIDAARGDAGIDAARGERMRP